MMYRKLSSVYSLISYLASIFEKIKSYKVLYLLFKENT